MNNFDFSELLHDEAVDILQSCALLEMKVLYIGKVPFCSYSPMDSCIANWSRRHSPQQRFFASSFSSLPCNETEMVNYSSSTNNLKSAGSPRLSRHSPQHKLTSLNHSNNIPTSSSDRQYVLGQTYKEECISPRNITSSLFDKRDTPTLLITDSDNRDLPAPHSELKDDMIENELFMLQVNQKKNYLLKKRLQNTKSEEDEQTLDEECMKYLNEKELLTLAYYRNEYETKAMTLDTLVVLLTELLDTRQKVHLSSQIYKIHICINHRHYSHFAVLDHFSSISRY